LRFFFIVLSVRERSELIAYALLDKLKRIREDYQLLAVAFSSSMVSWVTDITIYVSTLNGRSSLTQNFEIANYCSS